MASGSAITVAKRLEGKVALITGAASGIGAAAARLFSRHGASVVIADLQDDRGQAIASELEATFVHCDVTKEDHVCAAVDSTIAAHGKLDVMYNNAGAVDPVAPLMSTELHEFRRITDVNLVGAFLGAKHAARVMVPAGEGSIIFTASNASVIGGIGTHAYTSSKHAVVGLVRSAAVELGQYGIRANCVSPHGLATPLSMKFLNASESEVEEMVELCNVLKRKVLRAEDVAQAALFLASDESKYMNGHNLVVDGGYSIANPTIKNYMSGR